MSSSSLLLLSAAATTPGGPPAWTQIIYFAIPMVAVWFLIFRPQMKRQRELQGKIGGLKKGDQVLTAGGLLGKVVKVDEHYVDLDLGPNVRVKALKSTIADVVPPGGAAAND